MYHEFYLDGKLRSQVYYKDGKKDGLLKGYYNNGKLKVIYNYENDILNGPIKSFYSTGKLKFKGHYKNGKPDSLTTEYYVNGQIKKFYYYKEGDIFYYKAYAEDGIFYDSKLPIQVSSKEEKTCYSLEKDHKIKIELLYTLKPSETRIVAVIGKLDKNNKLTDTLDIVGSYNNAIYYQKKPDQKGVNEIEGVLYELNKEENIIGAYYFMYEYCVE